ncbi:MAG: hypothetical protein JXR48_12110 [Candidatus Delongbacteria bacterium]|nr:hypothetical protein [Candidatus Delongbacteria bacterium]
MGYRWQNGRLLNDDEYSSKKKKVENAPKPILFKIGVGLSIILGFIFLIRYDSFISLLIITILAIGGLFGINKMIFEVSKRNLLLGALNILLVVLIIVPIGKVTDYSSKSSSDSTDDIAYMKCRYCGEEIVEKNNQGIMCYTSEPDGIGVLTFYSGSKYDVYCSEECAKKGILVGYGHTEH